MMYMMVKYGKKPFFSYIFLQKSSVLNILSKLFSHPFEVELFIVIFLSCLEKWSFLTIGFVLNSDLCLLVNFLSFLGTIAKGAALLHQEGAREVYACCTHAVFRF